MEVEGRLIRRITPRVTFSLKYLAKPDDCGKDGGAGRRYKIIQA